MVEVNPDSAQLPVRLCALIDHKILYMAVPRLAGVAPFYLLDPDHVGIAPAVAATKEGAASAGLKIDTPTMMPIDIAVCGSVAVARTGARLGKGAGYTDSELALLKNARLIGSWTTIVTTVHPHQVLDEQIPQTQHDVPVDLIVTPDEVIACH